MILTFGELLKLLLFTTLRQQIQEQLNRIELSNKFSHAVFFDNDQEFQDGEPEDQQLSAACQVIIQNSIILWNYLFLSNLIMETECSGQQKPDTTFLDFYALARFACSPPI